MSSFILFGRSRTRKADMAEPLGQGSFFNMNIIIAKLDTTSLPAIFIGIIVKTTNSSPLNRSSRAVHLDGDTPGYWARDKCDSAYRQPKPEPQRLKQLRIGIPTLQA